MSQPCVAQQDARHQAIRHGTQGKKTFSNALADFKYRRHAKLVHEHSMNWFPHRLLRDCQEPISDRAAHGVLPGAPVWVGKAVTSCARVHPGGLPPRRCAVSMRLRVDVLGATRRTGAVTAQPGSMAGEAFTS